MDDTIENVEETESVSDEAAEDAPEMHGTTLSIEHPAVVYALTDIPIKVDVQCAEGCPSLEGTVRLVDDQGEELASTALLCKEGHGATELSIRAPEEPGHYAYQAIFEAAEESGHRGTSVDFPFETREHRVVLSAWGVQTPATIGETFTVKIGARCPGNCSLAGMGVTVVDDKGGQVAQATLEDRVLAGTSGTYYAEVDLPAPSYEDVFTWKVEGVFPETGIAHRVEAADFTFRTAVPPEHRVTVSVMSARDNLPLEMTNVMIGLRRTFTDEQGIASLEVPGGSQMLRVSKQDYRLYAEEIAVEDDAEFMIELVYDPTL